MYHEVCIQGLLLDPITNRPVLVLKEAGEERVLLICIGASEANVIALQLENIPTPRPMTHDLLCGVLESVEGTLKEVRICDHRDDTYFARLIIGHDGKELEVDARPSDAVALALKNGVPVYVNEKVFALAEQCEECDNITDSWLRTLSDKETVDY